MLTDSQPGLPLWSSSSHTNFTDTGGSEELSFDMTNIYLFWSPLMSAFDVNKHLVLFSRKAMLVMDHTTMICRPIAYMATQTPT